MSRPTEYRHWTPKGTFKITRKTLQGSWFYDLWFRETYLGMYCFLPTAAQSISEGVHDQKIGLQVSALGVPSDPDKWNGSMWFPSP